MSSRGTPLIVPIELKKHEFVRSNVFVACSRKVGREIRVIGPSCYDAWLVLEFDPAVLEFCERPPLYLALLPTTSKRARAFDFWVRRCDGYRGIVIVNPHDKRLDLDVLRRSIAASQQPIELWLTSDLERRRVYLRNLKLLAPFVACECCLDRALLKPVLTFLFPRPQRWGDVRAHFSDVSLSVVDGALAYLIHAGEVRADLTRCAIDSDITVACV